jgi:hypothetical protein
MQYYTFIISHNMSLNTFLVGAAVVGGFGVGVGILATGFATLKGSLASETDYKTSEFYRQFTNVASSVTLVSCGALVMAGMTQLVTGVATPNTQIFQGYFAP